MKTVYNKTTGEAVLVHPVDAREMLAGGYYQAEPLTSTPDPMPEPNQEEAPRPAKRGRPRKERA